MDDKTRESILAGEFIAYPGLRLCQATEEFIPGEGTYDDQGFIFSCLVGVAKLIKISNDRHRLEVVACGGGTSVARVGDIVTAQVTRVTSQTARCQLRCAGPRALSRSLRAILRRENVRATAVDRVDMYKCFRAGDIILARIMPMAELQCYQLSTAEPELGVVIAKAADAPVGVTMVPLTWNEMQCPFTLAKEPRKVAKVAPENVYEFLETKTEDMSTG